MFHQPIRQWLAAALIVCLVGLQFAGLAHRVLHEGAPASPVTLLSNQTSAHAHADSWIVQIAESVCLQGDDCAALDHLLCALALATAAFILALIASTHAQAARIALACFSNRPLSYHSRGPPR
jgi:hypothetical protein